VNSQKTGISQEEKGSIAFVAFVGSIASGRGGRALRQVQDDGRKGGNDLNAAVDEESEDNDGQNKEQEQENI